MSWWSSQRYGSGQAWEGSTGDREERGQERFRGQSTRLKAGLWDFGEGDEGFMDPSGFPNWADGGANCLEKDNGKGPLWESEMRCEESEVWRGGQYVSPPVN